MFSNRYFATSYFSPRYFANGAAGGGTDTTGTGAANGSTSVAGGTGAVVVTGYGSVIGRGPAAAGVGTISQPPLNGSGSFAGYVANGAAGTAGRASATGRFYRTLLTETPGVNWRLGESAGTVGYSAGPYSLNGTYGGTYTLGVAAGLAGDVNTAATFNGGYLQVPDDAVLGGGQIGVLFRFKTSASGTAGVILDKRSGSNGYALRVNAGGTLGLWWNGAWYDTPASGTGGAFAYNDGQWHTAYAVWLSAVTPTCYVDGRDRSPATAFASATLTTAVPLYLGSDSVGAGVAVSLDEVAVFSVTGGIDANRLSFLHSQTTYAPTLETPAWNSRPSASKSVYLCMDGRPAEADQSFVAIPEYGTIADRRLLFDRVAAAFAAWDVNVTTVDSCKYADAPVPTGRCIVGGDGSWSGTGFGGFTTIGGYYGGGSNTSYVFPGALSNSSWTIACGTVHEIGHGWGLHHQSVYSGATLTNEYNPGNGTRAPVMGVAYSSARALWWKGQTSQSSATIEDALTALSSVIGDVGQRNGLIRNATDSNVHPVVGPAVVTVVGDDLMLRPSIAVRDAAGTTTATSNTGAQTQTVSVPAGNCTVTVASNGFTSDGTASGGYYDVGTYSLTALSTSGSGAGQGQIATSSGAAGILVTAAGISSGQIASSIGLSSVLISGASSSTGQIATGSGLAGSQVTGTGGFLGQRATSFGVAFTNVIVVPAGTGQSRGVNLSIGIGL